MTRRLWTLALLAPALAAQDSAPGRGVNFYSIAKEQALGAQLAAEYKRSATVLESATVNAYLNDLGQRLVAKSPGGEVYTFTFELVDDQIMVNEPVAFPGGPIFVPAGLIATATREDEVAGMLAHAIAHVTARHGTKQATRGEILNVASIPLIYMGGWAGYAIRQGQALAIPLGFVNFHRQMELQADALAVQSMAGTGYDPAALVEYIGRVQAAETPPPKILSPLPEREARLAALRTAIEKLPATAYPAHEGFAAIQEEVARLAVKPAKAPPRLAR